MKLNIGQRGTGKTREMLMKAAEEGGFVVCASPEAMVEKMYRLGIVGVRVLSYEEFLSCYDPNVKYYIHDIGSLFSGNVIGTYNLD